MLGKKLKNGVFPLKSPEARVNLLLWVGASFAFLQYVVLLTRAVPLRSVAVSVAPVCEEVVKGSMAAFLVFQLPPVGLFRGRKFEASLVLGAWVGLLYGVYEFLTVGGTLFVLGIKFITHPIWTAVACLGMLSYWKDNDRAEFLAVIGAPMLAHAVWNKFVPVSLVAGWLLGTLPLVFFLIFLHNSHN